MKFVSCCKACREVSGWRPPSERAWLRAEHLSVDIAEVDEWVTRSGGRIEEHRPHRTLPPYLGQPSIPTQTLYLLRARFSRTAPPASQLGVRNTVVTRAWLRVSGRSSGMARLPLLGAWRESAACVQPKFEPQTTGNVINRAVLWLPGVRLGDDRFGVHRRTGPPGRRAGLWWDA
jgi:hypothetical protein